MSGIELANWNWKAVRRFVADWFGVRLCRSSSLNYLHRLGFAFKRPKKRLLKANEAKRESFVAEYATLWEQAKRSGGKIFFADKEEVKRRCRTVLQSKAETLWRDIQTPSQPTANAHPTLALV